MMNSILQKINLLWGGVCAALAAVFGEFWFLFAGFLLFNILDYITGWYKARTTRTENSCKGLKGIVKKVSYWVVIGIAFYISFAFVRLGDLLGLDLGVTVLFGWFTLATFLINELRSILENLTVIGVKIPAFLSKGLEVAAKTVEQKENGK